MPFPDGIIHEFFVQSTVYFSSLNGREHQVSSANTVLTKNREGIFKIYSKNFTSHADLNILLRQHPSRAVNPYPHRNPTSTGPVLADF